MANEQNLKAPSPSEARKRGAKGGKASGRARRERKAMKEMAQIVLDMPMMAGKLDDLEKMAFADVPDAHLTVGQKAVLAVAAKAVSGDVVALTFLRDTAGEKPTEKVEVSGEVAAAASDIRKMIASAKEKADDR